MAETVLCLREPPLLRIRLNRPQQRNAFDPGMVSLLRAAFGSVAEDPDLRVVLLEGEGAVFCGGADLEQMRHQAEAGEEENRTEAVRMAEMFAAIDSCPRPVVSIVRGAALGGGCGLVAASDLALASSDAVFGFTEVRLGLLPAVISPYVLAKVAPGEARRYFLTGERFGADEALRIGLVQIVSSPGEIDAAVGATVDSLLRGGPEAQREIKALLRALPAMTDEEVVRRTAEWIARVRATGEGREGISAFLEKRDPRWSLRRQGNR